MVRIRPTRAAAAVVGVALALSISRPAAAQPGRTPPGSVPPRPVRRVQLTPKEQKLLAEGEISQGQHLAGGLISLFFGLGIGQAVQGRYTDTGWIFTVGEVGTGTGFVYGFVHCLSDDESGCSIMVGSMLGMLAFRVWEILDAFIVPAHHNRKVRAIRRRLYGPTRPGWTGFVAPAAGGEGGVAGLQLRF